MGMGCRLESSRPSSAAICPLTMLLPLRFALFSVRAKFGVKNDALQDPPHGQPTFLFLIRLPRRTVHH